MLARLYAAARLHTNLFQPSFKLRHKTRIGARVIKRHRPPVIPEDRILAHTVVDEAKPRQLQAVSDPVALIAETHTAQGGLRKRVDRREREPEPLTDIKGFTAGLSIALAHRRATPDESSPYRRRKPIPRRASMLDDLREQIGAW